MTESRGGKSLLAVATVVVVAAVIAGVWVLGSPRSYRQQRLDEVRVNQLIGLERSISSFARVHKALPPDLASLSKEPGYSVPLRDPEFAEPYVYEVLSADTYRLCANFATNSADVAGSNAYVGAVLDANWAHAIGRQCFERHADVPGKSGEQRTPDK